MHAARSVSPIGRTNIVEVFNATKQVQSGLANFYDGLNKTLGGNRSQMNVNMDGTISVSKAEADRNAQENGLRFNPSEYMSKAISDLKSKSDAAYAMMQNNNLAGPRRNTVTRQNTAPLNFEINGS